VCYTWHCVTHDIVLHMAVCNTSLHCHFFKALIQIDTARILQQIDWQSDELLKWYRIKDYSIPLGSAGLRLGCILMLKLVRYFKLYGILSGLYIIISHYNSDILDIHGWDWFGVKYEFRSKYSYLLYLWNSNQSGKGGGNELLQYKYIANYFFDTIRTWFL